MYKKLLNDKYRLIDAKKNEIITLWRAGVKKTEISKPLNITKMTVYQEDQSL